MNLAQLRAAYKKAIDRLSEIRGMDSLTDEVRSEVPTLLEEARSLKEQIDTLVKADAAIASFEEARSTSAGRASGGEAVASARIEAVQSQAEEVRSAGDIVTSNERYKAWASEQRSDQPFRIQFNEEESRALANTALLPAAYLQAQRIPGIQRDADIYGSLRDVLITGTTSQESLVFFKENVFTNGAAFVGEATAIATGGLKPESGITFTQATAGVGTIAHWLPITNQLMWVAPELRSYIDGRLLDGLNLTEDLQLLSGDGTGQNPTGLLNTSGIQVLNAGYFATNPTQNAGTDAEPFDRVARAKRLIASLGRARASFIVLNPADVEYFQTIVDGNNHYFAGGPFGAGVPQTLWGLRIVTNENIASGTALVGDGTAAQIWDRMAATITVGLINDQFIRNEKTVLAEKRVGLAVYRPKAFATVSLFA